MLSNIIKHTAEGLLRVRHEMGDVRFGIEVGSLSTFFSAERPALGAVTHLHSFLDGAEASATSRLIVNEVQMADAHLKIEELEHANKRTLRVTALQDSQLMDAVIRFVFPLAKVERVAMNDKTIPWARRNFYHQYENGQATIHLKDGRKWRFTVTVEGDGLPRGMHQMTYLRDEPNDWVLHARVRANEPDFFSLRGCMRWYNKPLPGWVQTLWNKLPALANATLHIRERISQRIPLQTNGAVLLKKGQSILFTAHWVDITEEH